MKRLLTNRERSLLEERIAQAEKLTGAQIVLAIIERCDSYAEIPWKAFALGVSIAALLVFILDLLWPVWYSPIAVLISVVIILLAGIVTALITLYILTFARFFLAALRSETEARQYAESLFLSRELYATRRRTGVLLLVSLFERRIVLLPDTGLSRRLNQKAMQKVIMEMRPSLVLGQVAFALEKGLDSLEEILATKRRGKSRKNELSNYIIEEKGV